MGEREGASAPSPTRQGAPQIQRTRAMSETPWRVPTSPTPKTAMKKPAGSAPRQSISCRREMSRFGRARAHVESGPGRLEVDGTGVGLHVVCLLVAPPGTHACPLRTWNAFCRARMVLGPASSV